MEGVAWKPTIVADDRRRFSSRVRREAFKSAATGMTPRFRIVSEKDVEDADLESHIVRWAR